MNGENRSREPSDWCLRFATGAMRGKTLALARGANVLGSSAGCDILLPGDVRARHLRIEAGDVAIAMQRMEGATVRLNGEDVAVTRRALIAGDRLTIGALELDVDRVAPAMADSMFLDPDEPSSQVPPPALTAPDAPRWPTVAVFLAALAIAVPLMWLAFRPPGAAGADSAGVNLPGLQAILADYPEVRIEAERDGDLVLTGFVESGVRRDALAREAEAHGGVHVRVEVVDQLVDSARRFLGDPAVAVSYSGRGRLVITGASDDEAVKSRIRRLTEDLHPGVLVTDRVSHAAVATRPASDDRLWAHWQSLLPSRVVSITESEGGMRHIQLANGHRYYEGALLKSGAELKLVSPTELMVAPGADP